MIEVYHDDTLSAPIMLSLLLPSRAATHVAACYKCFVTSTLVGSEILLLAGRGASSSATTTMATLVVPARETTTGEEDVVIAGEEAICRYLLRRQGRLGLLGGETVDCWTEWDIRVLTLSLSTKTTTKATAASVVEVGKALQILGEKIEEQSARGSAYLCGDALSLADVFTYCSLKVALTSDAKVLTPLLQTYVSRLEMAHKELVMGIEKADKALAHLEIPSENESKKVKAEISASAPSFSVEAAENYENIFQLLENLFGRAIGIAFPGITALENFIAAGSKDGIDFQCNAGMRVLKEAKLLNLPNTSSATNAAQAITDAFLNNLNDPAVSLFSSVQVTPQGFINIYVSERYAEHRIMKMLNEGKASLPKIDKVMKVGIDFSSPNIAKEMHVGHLRSTIIGDAIARLLEHVGHKVMRINHVGDWGTQFGMLLTHLDEMIEKEGDASTMSISDLSTFYREAKKRFDLEPEFNKKSHEAVVRLQSGDEHARKRWHTLIDISTRMFDEVYSRLDVRFPDGICGESFYNDKIPAVIDELRSRGFLTQEGGAELFFTGAPAAKTVNQETGEPCEIPLILRKGDGGYGYDSTDTAAIHYRLKTLGLDWLIYVTDTGQSQHFQIVFECARKAGWVIEGQQRLDHVKFGLVLSPTGGKYKSREGSSEKLVDLLDEAKSRMYKELVKRIGTEGTTTTIAMEDAEQVASQIGYAAIKYADLRCNREKDYTFNYDLMLNADGDTAVYLQYSFARMCSIERKVEAFANINAETALKDLHARVLLDRARYPHEWALALHVIKYPEYLVNAVNTLYPHILCDYVHKLSVYSSKFLNEYRLLHSTDGGKTHTLDPELGPSRLLLLHSVRLIMLDVFQILGFAPLTRI